MRGLAAPIHVDGVTSGVTVDPGGRLLFKFTDPSFALRMLNLGTTVPGLLLVAEIARRLAKLLRAAQHSDPFTAGTARQLMLVAKITVFGGLVVWAVASLTRWALSSYVLASGTDFNLLHQTPLGWLGAGLIIAGFGQVVARGVEMRRDMTLVELSAKGGVTVANLSILKNGHARAIRFTTLTAICDVLGCSPGELLTLRDEPGHLSA